MTITAVFFYFTLSCNSGQGTRMSTPFGQYETLAVCEQYRTAHVLTGRDDTCLVTSDCLEGAGRSFTVRPGG